MKLRLKDDAQPHAIFAARKIPIPLMPAVKEALAALEQQGVIERVSKPTDWVSPMVPVVKPNSKKVRITVDYKRLNQHLQRETYPIPSFENLASKFNGATCFSKLDASYFNHCKTDEDILKMLCNHPNLVKGFAAFLTQCYDNRS